MDRQDICAAVKSTVRKKSRAAAGISLAAAALAAPSFGQTAFFSLTGDLDAADATQDFGVRFTRDVVAADNPQFKTFHRAGGTNAAGQVIASASFDPLLNLQDTFSGIVNVTNDDGGPGHDAFLAYPGNGNTGGNLGTLTLPNQLHTLELRKFTTGAAGPWAVDILGPAGVVDLTTSHAAANSALTDLIFGTTGAGTDTARVLLSTPLPAAITGNLTVAHTGNALFQINTGAFTAGGLTRVNSGGTLRVFNTSVFTADGGVRLLGGGTGSGVDVRSSATLNIKGSATPDSGSGSTGGGVFHSSGTVNLSQSGVLNLDGQSVATDATGTNSTGGHGGTVNLTGGTVSLIANSKITARGGQTGRDRVGRSGGPLTLTGSSALTLANSSEVLLTGGRGGDASGGFNDFSNGGTGGDITLTDSSLLLSNFSKLTADGGLGGNQFGGGSGSNGGDAGSVTLDNSQLTVVNSAKLSLGGGNGFTLFGSVFDHQSGDGGRGGDVTLNNASTLTVNGGEIANDGGNPGFHGGSVGNAGTFTVNGGTMTLTGGTLRGAAGTASATPTNLIGAKVVVNDAGILNLNSSTAVSGGRIDIINGSTVNQPGSSSLALTNDATVKVTGTSSTWTAAAGSTTVHAGSTLNLTASGTFTTGSTLNLSGGTLRGNGEVVATGGVTNAGVVILDRAADGVTTDLRITGDYTQTAAGRLEAGKDAGSSFLDALFVIGDIDLAGELAFTAADPLAEFGFITPYNDAPGLHSVVFGTGSSTLTGVFTTVTGHLLGDGTALAVLYDGNDVPFQRVLYGDANLSQQIEQGDLDAVLQNWGKTSAADGVSWVTGDLNGNGQVEQGDLDAVLQNWGSTLAPDFKGAAVPEPAAAVLGMLAAGLTLRLRRKR